MTTALRLEIENQILSGVNPSALGNSKRRLPDLCSDLINQAGTDRKTYGRIAAGCFLDINTIERMSKLTLTKSGRNYNPSDDTIERILRYFGIELEAKAVTIKSRYRNKPKDEA